MHPYPHVYIVSAAGGKTGSVTVSSSRLPDLETASPPEFDGPGNVWSPENLLCAAVADCFVLTFRAVSRAARLEWLHLDCRVEGVLDRVGKVLQFTQYKTIVELKVPAGTDVAKASELLERAERGCLIANSVRGTRVLEANVVVSA